MKTLTGGHGAPGRKENDMKLTKEQKERVSILKDTLKHLMAGRINPLVNNLMIFPERVAHGCELQTVLKKFSREKKPCKVCQRGGILYSMIWKNNEFRKSATDSSLDGSLASSYSLENDYLEKLFSRLQLAMMETAFERGFNEYFLESEQTGLHGKCVGFKPKLKKGSRVLFKAILNNAIKNNGEFRP